MNQAVEAFLNEVWKEVTAIYAKESKRINEPSNQSRLQAGIMDYLQVAWRKGKHTREAGKFTSMSMSRSPGATVPTKLKRALILRS